MTEIWPEAMVTAHRKISGAASDWAADQLRDRLPRLVGGYGLKRVTCGMAPGGDQVFGLIAKELDIPLRAAIPYPSQPLDGTHGHFGPAWTKLDRARWEELFAYAEQTGGIEHVFNRDPRSPDDRVTMLHARNDWMLDRSQQVIGLWEPGNLRSRRSGTSSCLRKAVRAGFLPILFNLTALRVTRPELKHWAKYLNTPSLLTVTPRRPRETEERQNA